MERVVVELLGRRDLDDPAEVHDRDPVGDVADDGQVVRDEEVGKVEVLLEALEQVDDLRLDRDVEGETGSSQTMKSRFSARERARPMRWRWPPRLVRIADGRIRRQADDLEELAHARPPPCRSSPCTRSGSLTMRPTEWRGLSDA